MTTKQRSDLLRLFEQRRSITDSARCVGVCRETARELAVSVGYHGYGQGKRGPAPKKYYTVYLNMDDSIVTSGTAMSDQFQLVLFRSFNPLHHGCKGMAARMWSVSFPLFPVHYRNWVIQMALFKDRIPSYKSRN